MRALQFLVVGLIAFMACQPVPVTGRKQFALVPDRELAALASEQYREFLQQNEVVTGTPEAQMVRSVGNRIRSAVEQQFPDEEWIRDLEWEFNLINDTGINAFAMPGGKVAVFTGILPITQNETGLAVVMGHEIAHIIARHGNERMSQMLALQLGGLALSEALRTSPERTRQLALAAFGLGAQVGVLLPYSRTHESEADRLGLIFMARAGYDPREAVPFWRRMDEQAGPRPPEFLSTHPAGETRIRDIEEHMPEALRNYRGGGEGG